MQAPGSMHPKAELFITPDAPIIEALKRLDATAEKSLLVVDGERVLIGVLTDGDIRRHLLSGGKMDASIDGIFNPNPIFLPETHFTMDQVRRIMFAKKVQVVPVVDERRRVIDYASWKDIFDTPLKDYKIIGATPLDIPVAIMAGGKGTRLEPFTTVLPKPLIPVNGLPIIEHIIHEFRPFGIYDYYLTLNYKAEMIQAYFNSIEREYHVHPIEEDDYYGTAGSLVMLRDIEAPQLIVSNCDIIVHADYGEVFEHHRKTGSKLTILSAVKHYRIPYGVLEMNGKGTIERVSEKPEYTFVVNTGVYMLDTDVLKTIPEKTVYHMTDLINDLLEAGETVSTYPVNESEYIDIGQWEEYRRACSLLDMR